MKTAVKYNPSTGKINGTIQVATDSDLLLNILTDEEAIEISPDHPILSDRQENWEIKSGELKRIPQQTIDIREKAKTKGEEQRIKEAEERRIAPLLVLLNGLNEVRAKQGLSLLDTKLVVK